jgi:hypothetical protein
VIKFFLTKGQEGIEIDHRLRLHYHDDAMKKSAFYFSIAEIHTGRSDSSNSNCPTPLV